MKKRHGSDTGWELEEPEVRHRGKRIRHEISKHHHRRQKHRRHGHNQWHDRAQVAKDDVAPPRDTDDTVDHTTDHTTDHTMDDTVDDTVDDGKEEDSVALDDSPVFLELKSVVEKIRQAKPVGSKAHLRHVTRLRSLLSTEDDPPSTLAIRAGAVPVLIDALQPPQMDATALETTFQASWALTNLAVGHPESILPTAPILISYLSTQDHHGWVMAEQSAWAIGNIAEEDLEYRSILIANGALQPLVRLFAKTVKKNFGSSGVRKMVRKERRNVSLGVKAVDTDALSAGETAAWALSNLIKGQEEEVHVLESLGDGIESLLAVIECDDFDTSGSMPGCNVEEGEEHSMLFWGIIFQSAWLLARFTHTSMGCELLSEEVRRRMLDSAAMRLRIVLSDVDADIVSGGPMHMGMLATQERFSSLLFLSCGYWGTLPGMVARKPLNFSPKTKAGTSLNSSSKPVAVERGISTVPWRNTLQ
jgi:hypothetical protein